MRLDAGLSVRGLADEAGISFRAARRACMGEPVSEVTVAALAAVLGPEVREATAIRRPYVPVGDAPVLAARRRNGESRRKAAERIGVSEIVLRRAETGGAVRPVNARRIAEAYGLSVADVLPVPGQDENPVAA